MMYRPTAKKTKETAPRKSRKRVVPFVAVVCTVLAVLVFVSARKVGSDAPQTDISATVGPEFDDCVVESIPERPQEGMVYRRRLLRSEIPAINYRNIRYRELLNDINDTQLVAARKNGIEPESLNEATSDDRLVMIFSTDRYRVDTMYHSVPYLLPEAALLLNYISIRFEQLMEQHYPNIGKHRIIVTSALRTEQSERNLRRVNRNATDSSCHLYGTTFDISAQRYEHSNGRDTVVEACKQMLALALYEIRYEGLCYVKYERGSCFHITLRSTQYNGSKKSETRSYYNPGSPQYMKTKVVDQPRIEQKIENSESGTENEEKTNTTQAENRKEKMNNQSREQQSATKEKSTKKKEPVQKQDEPKTNNKRNDITERERMSLDMYERRSGM